MTLSDTLSLVFFCLILFFLHANLFVCFLFMFLIIVATHLITNSEFAARLGNKENMELPLGDGADVNVVEGMFGNILHTTRAARDRSIEDLLLKLDAKLREDDSIGK